MNSNKNIATEFLHMIIAGEIDAAYEKYVNMQGKHHNVQTPAGFLALREGMKEVDCTFPNKEFTTMHVIGEGDLVAVHSHLVLGKEGPDLAVIHLLRFENGKIVEIWDVAQPTPADCVNQDGAF